MKEIPLTQGQVTLVDDEDFESLSILKWCALWDPSRNAYCVFRNPPYKNGKRSGSLYMHRVIMRAKPGEIVDHRDHNPLNNQRFNLRLCDAFESARNKRKQTSNTTGFIGVTRHGKGYWARVRAKGRQYSCGVWFTAEEAAIARDKKAFEIFGEYAVLNSRRNI